MITVAATGNTVVGHVMDVSKVHLERKLQEYDKQLYLKWNPRKNKKQGCWELRRKPDHKSLVYFAEWNGGHIVKIDWHELDIINHVLDLPYLNYSVVEKVKQMDTWSKGYGIGSVAAQAERNLDYYNKQQAEKNRAEMLYQAKQYKKEWKDLRENILSGMDPTDIARYWGKR